MSSLISLAGAGAAEVDGTEAGVEPPGTARARLAPAPAAAEEEAADAPADAAVADADELKRKDDPVVAPAADDAALAPEAARNPKDPAVPEPRAPLEEAAAAAAEDAAPPKLKPPPVEAAGTDAESDAAAWEPGAAEDMNENPP